MVVVLVHALGPFQSDTVEEGCFMTFTPKSGHTYSR